MAPRSFCCWWRLISTAFGALAGYMMFILFFVLWKNYPAGVWALGAGIFASVGFHVTYLHYRRCLDAWHTPYTLQSILLLGLLGGLAGLVGVCWYIFTALYYHIPLLPMSSSAFITAVWAAIMMKYGIFLLIISQMFSRELQGRQLIVDT